LNQKSDHGENFDCFGYQTYYSFLTADGATHIDPQIALEVDRDRRTRRHHQKWWFHVMRSASQESVTGWMNISLSLQ
jgi:hypothetical protein